MPFLKILGLVLAASLLSACGGDFKSPIAVVWPNGTPPAFQARPAPGDVLPVMDANLDNPTGELHGFGPYRPTSAQRALYLSRLEKAVYWRSSGQTPCRTGEALLVRWHLPGDSQPVEPLIGCWNMETSYFHVIEGDYSRDGTGFVRYSRYQYEPWRLVLTANGMVQYRQVEQAYDDWARDRHRRSFAPAHCVSPTYTGAIATPAGKTGKQVGCVWPD